VLIPEIVSTIALLAKVKETIDAPNTLYGGGEVKGSNARTANATRRDISRLDSFGPPVFSRRRATSSPRPPGKAQTKTRYREAWLLPNARLSPSGQLPGIFDVSVHVREAARPGLAFFTDWPDPFSCEKFNGLVPAIQLIAVHCATDLSVYPHDNPPTRSISLPRTG